MTSGFVLIVAVLVLGGVIATAGDRIGMRVGKARLSLFNMRPRQTATLITILTGGVISATTLGLLFAVSEQLRTGVFKLNTIQDELSEAQEDLEDAQQQQRRIEDALTEARTEQEEAEERLQSINQSLRSAIARQERTEAELAMTQAELSQVEANFQEAQAQLQRVLQQEAALRSEIEQLQTERQQLIAQRERELAQRDREIAEKENQLQALETQRTFLAQEVQALEQELQALREGNVVLLNNQLLAAGVVRVADPDAAPQAVDQLLRQANRAVLQAILPGTQPVEAQVIQITSAEVEELIAEISDGEDYVVQILSGGNYLVGEPCVIAGQTCIEVVAQAVPNQVVFSEGEVIAAASVNPTIMSNDQLIDRLELLIAAAQFRARQAGILRDTIQLTDDQEQRIDDFFEQLTDYVSDRNRSLTIQAIAANDIYTVGPLEIELLALQDGNVIFSTIQTPNN